MTEPLNIPIPQSHDRVSFESIQLRNGLTGILKVDRAEVLFSKGLPIAVATHGNDVLYPDLQFKAAEMKLINAFLPKATRTRTTAFEFDYVLASALMGQLRPLTRGPNAQR